MKLKLISSLTVVAFFSSLSVSLPIFADNENPQTNQDTVITSNSNVSNNLPALKEGVSSSDPISADNYAHAISKDWKIPINKTNERMANQHQFVTTDYIYQIGKRTEQNYRLTNTQVYFVQAKSYIEPMHSGWGLFKVKVPSLRVNLLLKSAKLKAIYVKKCSTNEWVNVNQTSYAPDQSPVYEVVDKEQNTYTYLNPINNSLYPGEQIDPTYECSNGSTLNVQTYVGTRKLVASGTLQFAYVIEHTF